MSSYDAYIRVRLFILIMHNANATSQPLQPLFRKHRIKLVRIRAIILLPAKASATEEKNSSGKKVNRLYSQIAVDAAAALELFQYLLPRAVDRRASTKCRRRWRRLYYTTNTYVTKQQAKNTVLDCRWVILLQLLKR